MQIFGYEFDEEKIKQGAAVLHFHLVNTPLLYHLYRCFCFAVCFKLGPVRMPNSSGDYREVDVNGVELFPLIVRHLHKGNG